MDKGGQKAKAARFRRALQILAKDRPLGKDPMPPGTWNQILFENVAYLADDARRAVAFLTLKRTVGLAPSSISKASTARLRSVGKEGILPAASAEKLRRCAAIVLEDFGGNPRAVEALAPDDFRRAVRKFPGIGAPAADRLMLYARKRAALALDSNGLRVMLRMGFGSEAGGYAKAYSSVQKELSAVPAEFGPLVEAYRLLRRHGQTLCRRREPQCSACPLRAQCPTGIERTAANP